MLEDKHLFKKWDSWSTVGVGYRTATRQTFTHRSRPNRTFSVLQQSMTGNWSDDVPSCGVELQPLNGRRGKMRPLLTMLLLQLVVVLCCAGCAAADPRFLQPDSEHSICYTEMFNASCPGDSVVMIDRALYGRMKVDGRCVRHNINIGCKVDVREYVERRCAGRRTCSMSANLQTAVQHGCSMDFNGYLQVQYSCVAVYNTDHNPPCSSNTPIEITASTGYLANVVTAETGRGSASCPWSIRGSRSQAVNITLLDFGDLHSDSENMCRIYARLKSGQTPATPVCGGKNRTMILHESSGNTQGIQIEIRNTINTPDPVYFLIHFQVNRGSACFDYVPKSDQLVAEVKSNDSTIVRCRADVDGRNTWTMSCIDGQWTVAHGVELTDCSKDTRTSTGMPIQSDIGSSNSGHGVLIVLGVALLVALIFLGIGVTCYVKRKTAAMSANNQQQFDPYGYGGSCGGPNQPGVMVDPSVGRSQKDLLDCCNNGPPMMPFQQQRQHRDYATTLEMRRQQGVWPQPGAWPAQNQMTPDVWSTGCTQCPVHGQYGHSHGTWSRHPVNHIYDVPLGGDGLDDGTIRHGGGGVAWNAGGVARWPGMGGAACGPAHPGGGAWNAAGVVDDTQPSSPFYNELEAFASIDSSTCILPQQADDRSRQPTGGASGDGRATDQRPPIPLTKL